MNRGMEIPPRSMPRQPARSAFGARSALGVSLALGIASALALPLTPPAAAGRAPLQAAAPRAEVGAPASVVARGASAGPLPRLLSQTGLFDGSGERLAPHVLVFSPQYPLWSDGATKRRWVFIPPGQSIDGTDPDAWVVPSGTRFWKELSFGARVETRYLEKLADGSFRFATYRWDHALGDAVLVPEQGEIGVHALPGGSSHDLPSRADCRACHEGRRSVVLGFNALQLSPARDPLAAHTEALPPGAVDLPGLVARGLLHGFPPALLQPPPRIVASSATARAARGYLFGNCSGCHNASGPLAELGLNFDQSVLRPSLVDSGVSEPSRFRLPGEHASLRIAPGRPRQSAIWFRMQSREPLAQMPPLGTKLVDRAGVQLISRWITSDR